MSETEKARVVMAFARDAAERRRIPSGTYRIQFSQSFTFRDALALVPYLDELGVSDCYASPLLRPDPNSDHGYDICDHSHLNPALGSEDDFERLVSVLHERGLGLILDTVPNHMGIRHSSNTWWMDVLENGPSSVYAPYFDIDWHPAKPELENRVLLPILEDQYGNVLEGGKLKLSFEDGAFFINYYETKLPVAPRTYSSILSYRLDALIEVLGEDSEHVQELQSILTALSYLPPRTELEPEKVAERNREKEVAKRRIVALCGASPEIRQAIDSAVVAFNGRVGEPRSFDLLDALLDEQAYRPAYWRVASEEINYRRFFDINELAAIRMEVPDAFREAHRLILQLLAEGKVNGLRIDHPDGLWNPPSYFRQLQESYVLSQVGGQLAPEGLEDGLTEAVAVWFASQLEHNEGSDHFWPLYVVAEKVLAKGESLPHRWAICGTTGYDFLNAVNGLFVDASHRKAFDLIYSRFVGTRLNFRELANSSKKMIMRVSMSSEINALSHQIERLAEKNRRYRDFTLNSLTFAIREVIAALPVYRTYITGLDDPITDRDRGYVEAAVAEAKRRNPSTAEAVFDFIRDTLLLRNAKDFDEEDRESVCNFVMKFQQITGPVMAKGVEDTAFYVYNRLVSLNEVGGDPDLFGTSVSAFHRQNAERNRRWPHSMLTTATHDAKRGEDVRTRIDVLSEMPNEWRTALTRWSRLNARKKRMVDGERAPDRNEEYLLYQTLVGAWPASMAASGQAPSSEDLAEFRERIASYMAKATKEAKVHTSWVNPNEEYDAAVRDFVAQVLDEHDANLFLKDFLTFQRRVAYHGVFNSLSQVLLKLTSPGVPDVYQGTELWDLNLVDPDNRRPVDYGRRRSLLSALRKQAERGGESRLDLARKLMESPDDGRIKLYITYRTLGFQREHRDLFARGSYQPIEADGEKRELVVAYARSDEDQGTLTVVPRLPVRLTGGVERPPVGAEVWQDSWLMLPREQMGTSYRNVFTGEVVTVDDHGETPGLSLAEVLSHFPVALLERLP